MPSEQLGAGRDAEGGLCRDRGRVAMLFAELVEGAPFRGCSAGHRRGRGIAPAWETLEAPSEERGAVNTRSERGGNGALLTRGSGRLDDNRSGRHGRRWGAVGKGRRRRTLGRGSAGQFLGYGSSRIGCAHQRLEVRSRNGLRTSSCGSGC